MIAREYYVLSYSSSRRPVRPGACLIVYTIAPELCMLLRSVSRRPLFLVHYVACTTLVCCIFPCETSRERFLFLCPSVRSGVSYPRQPLPLLVCCSVRSGACLIVCTIALEFYILFCLRSRWPLPLSVLMFSVRSKV